MTAAIDTSTPRKSYVDFIKCSRVGKFQRVPKEPGSKKLVHGEWVVVKPGDIDAALNAKGEE
jgi:hypothetical protein